MTFLDILNDGTITHRERVRRSSYTPAIPALDTEADFKLEASLGYPVSFRLV